MRGIIYCIKQKEKDYDSPIYIGSTKDFNMRKKSHKTTCYNDKRHEYNYKLYQYIRENGGWNTFDMIEIGMVECVTDQELIIEEQKWIDDLGATLNSHRAYRTIEDRKNQERQDNKKYYEKHKDKIKEKNKEKTKCECGSIVVKCNMIRHRKTKKHIKNIL
jgi:hypothetical protein